MIYKKMINYPHDILVNLAAIYHGIKPEVFTLKKERVNIFSEC